MVSQTIGCCALATARLRRTDVFGPRAVMNLALSAASTTSAILHRDGIIRLWIGKPQGQQRPAGCIGEFYALLRADAISHCRKARSLGGSAFASGETR